jgi:hypothetical protein
MSGRGALVSQSPRAEPAYLRLERLSWPLRAPVQPLATAQSLSGIVQGLRPCHPFPGPSDALC